MVHSCQLSVRTGKNSEEIVGLFTTALKWSCTEMDMYPVQIWP